MDLVKGQNISIASAKNLVIDLGWRSASADLHMQAHAIFYANPTVSDNADYPIGQIIDNTEQTQAGIECSADGRRFELNMPTLDLCMQKFTLLLALPHKSKYGLNKAKNLQAFISTKEGEKLATVKLADRQDSQLSAMHFLDIYRHRNEWKIKLVAQSFSLPLADIATILDFSLPDNLIVEPVPTTNKSGSKSSNTPTQASTPDTTEAEPAQSVNLREGFTLSMGESFTYSSQFPHISQITWKARTVPNLNDVKLSAIALNHQHQVNSIEDLVYINNRVHKSQGIELSNDSSSIKIDFDQLGEDIDKICLIATRATDSKRFSSADFIQTKLESSHTALPVCNFIFETNNKNYNCIILLEIYRHNSEWKIKAVGQGYADGLTAIGNSYGFNAPKIRPEKNTRSGNLPPSTQTSSQNTATPSSPSSAQLNAPEQEISLTTGLPGLILVLLGTATFLAIFSTEQLSSQFILLIFSAILVGAGSYLTIKLRRQAQHKLIEENERFMLNVIAQHNYQITAFDVAAKYSLTTQQATEILDNLCTKGAGKRDYNDKGVEVYTFDSIRNQPASSSTTNDDW